MIDPRTGSKLITLNLPDGTERHLKRLSPSDWLKLGNSLQSIRKGEKRLELATASAALSAASEEIAAATGKPEMKDAVRAILAKHGVIAASEAVELQKIDKAPVKHSDIERFLNTQAGQYTAILLALARDKPEILTDPTLGDDEMEKLGISSADWQPLMMELCNMEYAPPLPPSPQNLGGTQTTKSDTTSSPSTSAPVTT